MDCDKYPRTYHLPFSPGKGNDDKVLDSADHFLNTPLVISEKCDGSNVAMTSEKCFARTHSGPPTHPSFDLFKALHAQIKYNISSGLCVFGEWMYAKHSIHYSKLPAYFLMFGCRAGDLWLSWEDVEDLAKALGLETVPTIAKRMMFFSEKELKEVILAEAKKPSLCGGDREGVVLRKAEGFRNTEFVNSVAKYVRKNHVTTPNHWKDLEIVRNGVKDENKSN